MATLSEALQALFPDSIDPTAPFAEAPRLPADVFAYAGHLLERSGAYHHIAPEVLAAGTTPTRRVVIDDAMRARANATGQAWRSAPRGAGLHLPNPPADVEALWQSLDAFKAAPVFVALEPTAPPPDWWIIAIELVMIADEASWNIGFEPKHPFALPTRVYRSAELGRMGLLRTVQLAPSSISTAAEDILCVQPKSRTPSVGCTLRSLTHHLALLPPRGQVRARWVVSPFDGEGHVGEGDEIGLLLVPFPYRVPDGAFRSGGLAPSGDWGWFDVDQVWLPDDNDKAKRQGLVDFIRGLVSAARDRGQRVNGVVLPELALNMVQFQAVAAALNQDPEIDFLISGSSSDRLGRRGNFVAIAPFFLLGSQRGQSDWEELILVREKHHRWRLDSAQVKGYAFKGLDPDKVWWEQLSILSRSLDVLVYRGETTLTTLICEDLARVDPCQAAVRAVGPNLLIALLMDGPQIAARWPGRYATVLAEDPGTSVLSLTSFGLIARQNDTGAFGQSCEIALWKDEESGARALQLPREADAILVTLRAAEKTERTLDGRTDDGCSHRWLYARQLAIAAPKADWIRTGRARP